MRLEKLYDIVESLELMFWCLHFSVENWNRSNRRNQRFDEYFQNFCNMEPDNLLKNNVKLKFIGDIDALNPTVH